ncbi:MAG: hypothetical protein AMS15_03955 [Planctomycetes bacterium DG_23]|nr:MAG: hypothetical protein AMS15_03955 [Planctomycetes bacterium DG_23]
MKNALVDALVDLFRKAATQLPQDVLAALEAALKEEEPGSLGRDALFTILENVRLASRQKKPICQDTGTPVFYISRPKTMDEDEIRQTILEATRKATKEVPLRANAVDPVSGENTWDNVGVGRPQIYFETDAEKSEIRFDLLLKGGGSENIGQMYFLPDEELGAQRNLEGIRRCVLDAVFKAQGKGCPPYIVSACVGGPRDAVARVAKKGFLRPLGQKSERSELVQLEERLLREINELGIGPAGLGGKTTALAVHLSAIHRHPASFFVDVSFGCWALRRASLRFSKGEAVYE